MNPLFRSVQQVIRERKTDKVLGDPEHPIEYSADQLERGDRCVRQAIVDSGCAPFHYDRRCDGIAEPWRVFWMDCVSCRRLATSLPSLIPDMRPGNKMPALLSGCGSLTLFTWLPQNLESGMDTMKLQRINHEHLAATAAMVQNFLLLLTAGGINNYWASGTLISDHLFGTLGIEPESQLTAAVFASYPDGVGQVQMLPGKQRKNRSVNHDWLSTLSFDGVTD